jgi:DNA-binding SARP family transcriptional activator
MAQLQIRLFGGFRITSDGTPLPPPTPQRAALLSYLLIFSDRMHARSLLAGLFWGDLPDSRARQNLNDAVYRLRRQLDPPGTPEARSIIQSTSTHVGFNPTADVWIDVRQFLQLAQHTATIEQQLTATQLYTGDLLPGFYDDWVLLERERLAALHHQALANLLAHYQASGMVDTALDVAQRLVAADPLREDTTRELMKLYYRVGRRDRALALYGSLHARLAEELEVEPEQATTDLYKTIQAGWLGVDEPGGEGEDDESNPLRDLGRRLREMPLVGRDPERRRLADWLSTPRSMRTPMLMLEGETGVGKSRLAKDAADEAYRRGIFVLWGHYHEMAAPLPYGGLVEALRSGLRLGAPPPLAPVWLTEVSRLLPELTALRADLPPPVSLPPEQERVRLWEGLVQYLLALASTGPQMIILEDVQWIDSAMCCRACRGPGSACWGPYAARSWPTAKTWAISLTRWKAATCWCGCPCGGSTQRRSGRSRATP